MSAGAAGGLVGSLGPAVAAAAAAADAARCRNLEEETLTTYSDKDLAQDWQFKILRSASGVFKKPEQLQEVLEEEARAGWLLVEKFDDHRIRLKRHAEASKNDRHAGFDPWRSSIGASQGQREARIGILITALVLGVAALVFAVVFAIVGPPG